MNSALDVKQVRDVLASAVARYAFDAALFVQEAYGVTPDDWQRAVLDYYSKQKGSRLISVRSGHRVGKTTVLAWIIVHHLLFRFPQKTVVTAATEDQLYDSLAAETKAWLERLAKPWQELFDIRAERIELKAAKNESFVSFRVSRAEKPEALAGLHSEWVLMVVDEASGVPDAIFEAALGSLGNPNVAFILAGNPIRSSGYFYDTHNRLSHLWFTVHVNSENVPRVSRALIQQVKERYGERSNAYRVRVLGEFPLADDDTVIPFEVLETALHRDVQPSPTAPIVWGVDVARFGDDASALAKRKGNVLLEKVATRHGLDIMQVAGWVKHEYDMAGVKPAEIIVDAIGYGAGVADRLAELGLPIRAINVSESSSLKTNYKRLRDEMWFRGREWFMRRDCNIAGDEKLASELASVKYSIVDSSGKVQVESKKSLKARGLASPNRADAFLLTLLSDAAVLAGAGEGVYSNWREPLRRRIKGIV